MEKATVALMTIYFLSVCHLSEITVKMIYGAS